MKSISEKYSNEKHVVLTAIEKLIEYEIVPINFLGKNITHESLDEQRANLLSEKFIVSICGQIKTGKSTFLNYLLFNGDNIIPTDATPWTAKITKILYGEEPCLKVHYYSKSKWEGLKNYKETDSPNSKSFYELHLREELENRALKGIKETDKIKTNALLEEHSDIKKIFQFVAKDGDFTPFVDFVEIITNNQLIKDVIVVDTPGLNDPNPYRSALTKEFIDRSTAVIYLLHSSQPLSKFDVWFIDNYLHCIPSEKILFVLSQCDTVDSEREVKNYVTNTLVNLPELKKRNLLQDKMVYPISTMAAIISAKRSSDRFLSEEEKFHQERIPGYLLDNDGNLPELLSAIDEHIMKDKGEGIIQSFKHKIRGYCNDKINAIRSETGFVNEKIEALDKNEIDIQREKEKILELQRTIKREMDNRKKLLMQLTYKEKNITLDKLSKIQHKIIDEITLWINKQNSFQEVKDFTHYEVKKITESQLRTFFRTGIGKDFEANLNDFQEETKAALKDLSKGVLLGSRWMHLFSPIIDFQAVQSEISISLNELERSYLDKLRQVKLLLFTDAAASKKEIRLKIIDTLKVLFETQIPEMIGSSLGREADAFMDTLTENIDQTLTTLKKSLDSIKQEEETHNESLNQLLVTRQKLEEDLVKLESRTGEIMGLIGR